MNNIWTANLQTDEEKDRFIRSLNSSKVVLDRLAELIAQKDMDLTNSITSVKGYDSPSWAYKQAHLNGYGNAMRAVRQLINLDHQKETNVTI